MADNLQQSQIALIKEIDHDEKDYDSIFHLFGNNLEDFLDSEIIK